jgi:FkbM family methyltransferase
VANLVSISRRNIEVKDMPKNDGNVVDDFISFNYKGREVVMPDSKGSLSKHFEIGTFYEGHMLYAIEALGKTGVYVDVGANVGNHSVFFEMFCPSTMVVSFEPLDWEFSFLVRARDVNELTFDAHEIGLSDKEGEFVTEVGSQTYSIRTTTLDSFRLDDVAVIKIDIEGMEVPALRGMTDTLTRCRPHLFIEAHTKDELIEQESLLNALGYARTGRVWNTSPTYEWTHSEK